MTPYYEDGSVCIYHADTLDVLPTLTTSSAHAVITDPPYIIGSMSAGNMASKSGGWADMMNSSLWFAAWYRQVDRLLRHDGVFWTFCNWRSLPVIMRAAIDAQLPITSVAVWDKQNLGPGGVQGLRPSYEMIALLAQPGFSIPDRGISDVFSHQSRNLQWTGHPAEKPEGIVAKILVASALPEGSLIIDPFLGSGTTAKVAKDHGFKVIGIEAEERYCEIAARRCSQEVLAL